MDDIFGTMILLFLVLPLAYLALQLRALCWWQGGFRTAAAVPLLGWAVWVVIFAHDVTRDPTSHNLFPFEIAIGALAALVYLLLLAGLRRLAG